MNIGAVQGQKPAAYAEDAREASPVVTVESEDAAQNNAAQNQDRVDLFTSKEEENLPVSYGELMEKVKLTTSKPSDSSSQLTARLVAAVSEMDVRQVMSKAGTNLVSLRLVAAMGEGDDKKKAQQYIRKLEKLLDRAAGKIRDLNKEAGMERGERAARQAKEDRRAAEIKAELRQKRRARQEKERRWLREGDNERKSGDSLATSAPDSSADQMDAASEAQIAAEAQAMAAAETASADVGGGGAADFSAAGAAGGASPAPETAGGEAAAAAEVDISV